VGGAGKHVQDAISVLSKWPLAGASRGDVSSRFICANFKMRGYPLRGLSPRGGWRSSGCLPSNSPKLLRELLVRRFIPGETPGIV